MSGEKTIAALLFGLAAGPTAWIVHLVLDYGLASHACYPADQPYLRAPPPGWAAEKPILTVITTLCLAVALAGIWVSRRTWRSAREGRGPHHVAEHGEGRTCFLSLCGMLASTGFAVAIIVSFAFIAGAPSCWTFVA